MKASMSSTQLTGIPFGSKEGGIVFPSLYNLCLVSPHIVILAKVIISAFLEMQRNSFILLFSCRVAVAVCHFLQEFPGHHRLVVVGSIMGWIEIPTFPTGKLFSRQSIRRASLIMRNPVTDPMLLLILGIILRSTNALWLTDHSENIVKRR